MCTWGREWSAFRKVGDHPRSREQEVYVDELLRNKTEALGVRAARSGFVQTKPKNKS